MTPSRDPISDLLDDIQKNLSNGLTILGIVSQLRRSEAQLLPLLRTLLEELCLQSQRLPAQPEEDTR